MGTWRTVGSVDQPVSRVYGEGAVIARAPVAVRYVARIGRGVFS